MSQVVPPSGTVTFLFTDIEGSTALWEHLPASMPAAVERHDSIIRSSAERHGGHVFSTSGDGMAVAFGRVAAAVSAAVEAQRLLAAEAWPDGAVVRVRMALHTGEAQERDGDYFGPPLNRAARLMALASGGQILLSGSTAAVLDPPPPGIELVSHGSRRLRGVPGPVQVYGVRAEGVVGGDTLPRPADEARGNLPHPPTAFVGHALDLKQFVAELPSRRLVTLTGPGGVGKTRMAIEAASLGAREFPDGIWWVELGPVAVPDSVADAVAVVVGAQPQSGLSLEEAIVDRLLESRALLILDNCEHLIEPVNRVVARIVDGCAQMTVLTTSREPLGLAGERVHVVRSLDPALEGVELFCERARAADDTTTFDDADLAVVAGICDRLDGVPLAIELAAARSRSLTPAELLARLDDRFRLLRGGLRGGAERHQTLRTAVAWSHQLLTGPQRALFERLSVFAGTFDLAAAEAVCADDAEVDQDDVLDLLSDLVDRSMVVAVRDERATRYRLLETLRSFGEERLAERGQTTRLRDAHLAHYFEVAARTGPMLWSAEQFEGVAIYEREWDNLRAAFDWALVKEDHQAVCMLVMATAWYASIFLRHEHLGWFDRALAAMAADDPNRALTTAWHAMALCFQGEEERTVALALTALELAAEEDESPAMQRFLSHYYEGSPWAGRSARNWAGFLANFALATAYLNSGRGAEALAAGRRAEELAEGDPARQGLAAGLMVWIASGSDPGLVPYYARLTREFVEALQAPLNLALGALSDGLAELLGGNGPGALAWFQESLRLAGSRPSFMRGQALLALAWAASTLGQADAAAAFRDAISELYATRFWQYVWIAVEILGTYWVLNGHLEPGAVVIGHLETHGHGHATLEVGRAAAVTALATHPEVHDDRSAGARMDREGLVAYVLEELARAAEETPVLS